MSRRFISVFDVLDDTSDIEMRKVAIEAVRKGYAVIPVTPGWKIPLCTLTSQQAAKDPGHPCGVHHAITDPKEADRVFARLAKQYEQPLNIGIVAGPSRVVIVDADTAGQVRDFQADCAERTGDVSWLEYPPTVRTPGMQSHDGDWVHKDGGHWYFVLPDGVELEFDQHVIKGPTGSYDIKYGYSMCVAPPSQRKEGKYTAYGDAPECPEWIIEHINSGIVSRRERRERPVVVNDDVAEWSRSVTWESLLVPHGWTWTGKPERCGCMTYTKPGGGTTSWKSAVAHEGDCTTHENAEGHGPLHLWTTEPPAELAQWAGGSLTKLQFVSAMEYGNSVPDAMNGLGIGVVNLFELVGNSAPEFDVNSGNSSSEFTSQPGSEFPVETAGDRGDEPEITAVTSGQSVEPMFENGVVIGDSLGGVTDHRVDDDVVEVELGEEDFITRLRTNLVNEAGKYGIKESNPEFTRVLNSASSELTREMVRSAIAVTRDEKNEAVNSWFAPDSFIDEFLRDSPDGDAPSVLERWDGKHLFYKGRVNTVVARRAAGKTWLAIMTAISVLEAGGRVLYYDMEDTRKEWRARFLAVGFDIDLAVKDGRAVWVRPGDIPRGAMGPVVEYMSTFDLVVFDVMNRLTIRLGGDVDVANSETVWLYDNLFEPVAQNDTCVIVLDHPNRKGQRSDADFDDMGPGGGAMKLNNANGHVLVMRPVVPFTKDRAGGEVELLTLKDRCGHFEEGASVGRMVGQMDVGTTLYMRLSIEEPSPEVDADEVSLNQAKDRIVEVLGKRGPCGKGSMKKHLSPKLRAEIDWAGESLLAEGRIVEDADGRWALPE